MMLICTVAGFVLSEDPGSGKLPAFPGAEGFGAASKGGRGGKVIKVTNLKARGPGSLQAACSAKGPRIVVFDVSGVIEAPGKKNPSITITEPEIYIAGQTAPGAGITINGMLKTKYNINPSLHDIIIRFIRCRPTNAAGSGGDCLQITDVDRLMVDHVSVSWGCDENMDFCNSRDFTVQWCTIEESSPIGHPESKHNYGMIMGYRGKNATLHHCLFVHQRKRAPLCGLEVLDHRNNVIYNVQLPFIFHPVKMNRQRPGQPFKVNMVRNYVKSGPNSKMKPSITFAPIWKRKWINVYAEGNYMSWAKRVVSPPPGKRVPRPWPAPPVTMHTAQQAYALVLSRAGCLPRDKVTERQVNDVKKGTGSYGCRIPTGGLLEGLTGGEPSKDRDNDGIPDEWETKHNLDPDDPADGKKIVPAGVSKDDRHKEYTYIEYYVNECADNLIESAK